MLTFVPVFNTGKKVSITLTVGQYRNESKDHTYGREIQEGNMTLMVRKYRNESKNHTNGWEIQERSLLSFLYCPTVSVILTFFPVFPYH
jgi:hypothetical protein